MMRRPILPLVLLVLLLAAACGSDGPDGNDDTSTSKPPQDSATAATLPASAVTCHLNGTSPDLNCTPGTMNTNVREDNLDLTVCVAGWAAHERAGLKETTKRAVYDAYGVPRADRGTKFVLDHLVPVEAGGDPTASTNLWPQLVAEAKRKDVAENRAHKDLCDDHTTLQKVLERFRGGQW